MLNILLQQLVPPELSTYVATVSGCSGQPLELCGRLMVALSPTWSYSAPDRRNSTEIDQNRPYLAKVGEFWPKYEGYDGKSGKSQPRQ